MLIVTFYDNFRLTELENQDSLEFMRRENDLHIFVYRFAQNNSNNATFFEIKLSCSIFCIWKLHKYTYRKAMKYARTFFSNYNTLPFTYNIISTTWWKLLDFFFLTLNKTQKLLRTYIFEDNLTVEVYKRLIIMTIIQFRNS